MRSRTAISILTLVSFSLILISCKEKPRSAPRPEAKPIGTPITIAAPLGLPPVPIPADNPPTAETVALGRKLYYDKGLSVDNTVSCASCHAPQLGFGDGQQVSDGVRKQKGTRNAPTVFNSAYFTTQFWDGRAPSLEKQAEGPVANPLEMGHTLEGVERKLNADPTYRAEFQKAFGADVITIEMVEKSIASFERTVVSGNSPFDRYLYGGDKKALSASARRGLEVFRDPRKGNCAACHTIGEKYALFTDNKFHNLGVGVKLGIDGNTELTDVGRFKVTNVEADKGAFKTPSLRNIALTAPYMHDGSHKNLKEVIDFYIGGGNSNDYRDKEIHPLDFLTGRERADLQEFLMSLTGEVPPNLGPPAM
ncbi:MAG: cytochrome c peroxidase [Acidobacteriota bacterium]|nr:cytochrome c peroxidase [Acidobacteriota bacterium]